MKRADLPRNPTATYILPRWKTVYISVPKAACTSLKWLVAELQGEDPEEFYAALSRETGRAMTVHHRSRWQHTPTDPDLPDDVIEEISPDAGWFVFGVVRHPSARLWSGWQSKFLLQEPRFRHLYKDVPWPDVPQSTEDVVEGFHEFVRALDSETRSRVFDDRHFRTQTELLRPDAVPYTRIYRTSEIGELLDDLQHHLAPQGLETLPLLRRSNETPLLPVRELFSPEVTEIIGRHYAEDFEQFGYTDVVPGGLEPAGKYSEQQLAEVGRLVERGERIGDLYNMGRDFRSAEARVRKRLVKVRGRLKTLREQTEAARAAQPPTLLRRARGKAGRVARRVSGR